MEAFKVRLVHERRQLSKRCIALSNYLVTGKADQLPADAKKLLEQQLEGMMNYRTALESRMNLLGITGDELTFGQKAAGVAFNPSNLPIVDSIKDKFAEIFDELDQERANVGRGEAGRYYSKAISYAEDAQMNAVKGATWKD